MTRFDVCVLGLNFSSCGFFKRLFNSRISTHFESVVNFSFYAPSSQFHLHFVCNKFEQRFFQCIYCLVTYIVIDITRCEFCSISGDTFTLVHEHMLFPTPVGKSFSCNEFVVKLVPKDKDFPAQGLRGTLYLRALQLQPFMYKSSNFEAAFECSSQLGFRDETAPIAVGSTLAIAVLITVTGYGVFRYFKVKNVQYNTME